jgi:hypothetical protein
MAPALLFSEKQQFRQWWLWLSLLLVAASPLMIRSADKSLLLLSSSVFFVLALFFFMLRLETEIRTDGIYVRFFPFHTRFKRYAWTSMKACYVRQYSPLWEYGGWGLRFSLTGNGSAYNVSGTEGLQLVFLDGSRLLIGTRQPEKIKALLTKMGQLRAHEVV